jgi:hypothetical protein
MARGPSAAFGTRVPPRVGLLLRRGARKSPRDADAGGPTPIARVATRVVLLRKADRRERKQKQILSVFVRGSNNARRARARRSDVTTRPLPPSR